MDTTVELLICDLDGTLIASDAMWFRAACRAVARYHERRGTRGELPDRETTDAMIGEPPGQAFARLVPNDPHPDLTLLEDLAREEEGRELARGEDLALPGAREVLRDFRRRGGKVAVASNCDPRYLAAALPAGGFEDLVDLPLCIDPPRGHRTKADLVAHALEAFGTRRAMFVGDRAFDADAAAAHGVPFVGRVGGYARGEADRRAFEEAEGHFGAWSELPAVLARRVRALDELLGAILEGGFLRVSVRGGARVGKTLFVEELRERGRVRFGLRTPAEGLGVGETVARPADGVLQVLDGPLPAGTTWACEVWVRRSGAPDAAAPGSGSPAFAWHQERIHAPRWRRLGTMA